MKNLGAAVCFIMAAIVAYDGAAAKTFYPGWLGGTKSRPASDRPVPTRFGRLWFFGFSAILLYAAVRTLH